MAKEAAREAGDLLMASFRKLKDEQVGMKGKGDYVTELDHQSEAIILSRIKQTFPEHMMCAEESGGQKGQGYTWYVDPLDGTANYVAGIPVFAVSIGLQYKNQLQLGVVFHPALDEMFWAMRGEGAYLNGEPIHVSSPKPLADAFLGTGFPWRAKHLIDPYLATFREFLFRASGLRRMGAAATDLAYTACGIFDGFWEVHLKPWDIAAGALLVLEAGGKVTDFSNGGDYLETGNIVAGSPGVHQEMLHVVQRHSPNMT